MGFQEESSKDLSLRVLKAISKSVQSAVQLDEVPQELCYGEDVNLDQWTMALTDNNLSMISSQPKEAYLIDTSKPSLPLMFENFWSSTKLLSGLLKLSIREAKEVTDTGMALIAKNNPNLRELDISGCSLLGDVTLREIAVNCRNLLSLNIASCHAINGEGLIAVAECCRQLRKISIARCKNIERYFSTRVLYIYI
jgi:hypothetical protein